MSDTTLDTDVVLALDAIEELFAPARPALDAPVPGARPGIERALDELVARRTAEGARLVVVLPSAPAPGIDDAANDAIGRWCRQRVRENQFATDGLHRLGVRGLVPGLILLALGLLTAETLQRSSLPIDLRILGDGIAVVVAWVAIWYPLDTLFYARAPYRRANAALDAMSAMDVVLTTAAAADRT